MSAIILVIIAVCSFIFYGVIGPDKAWVLAPAFILAYVSIVASLLKKSWRLTFSCREQNTSRSTARFLLPVSSFLWFLFLIWGAAMVPQAVIPFDAMFRVLFVGAVIGSYVIWAQELTAFKDNRQVLGFMIFVVMLAALYGLILHVRSPESILWAERYVSYKGRLMSTYICPNHFAHLMQLLLPFCLALLFIPQAGIYLKVLSGYSFLIFLPAIFMTESRAAWLGSIAACGVVLCLMAFRRSWKLFAALVIVVPLCTVLLLFAGWRFSETFQRRAMPVVEFLQGQAEDGLGSESRDFRPQTWMDTIDLIKEAPLLGHGPGNYRYTFPEHRKRFKAQRIITGHPHNEYLELIADYGLIGFTLFAAAWLYGLIWVLVKSLKAEELRHAFTGFAFVGAAAGTMVHSFFDFQMHVFPNAMVFALLAVISLGPLVSEKRKKRDGNSNRSVAGNGDSNGREGNRLSAVLCWLISIGFLVLTVFCILVMSSAYFNAMGERMSERGNDAASTGKAENYYHLALKMDASNWRAYKGMGKLLNDERRHCLDHDEKVRLAEREVQWFELALEHNSKDPEAQSALGRAVVFLSRFQKERTAELQREGLDHLRKACQYRKFNDQYWWILGIELRKCGKYEEALEVFRSMEKVKRTKSSRKNIQWLEKQLAKPVLEKTSNKQDDETQIDPPVKDLMNILDAHDGVQSDSLDKLFMLMEP